VEVIMKKKYINLHVLTDFGLSLENEVNESAYTSVIKIKSFIKSLKEFNVLINPFNPKSIILNNNYKMIVLTIKENNLSWKDFDIYLLKTEYKKGYFYNEL
tara:strand:+ start:800 stop:1102 length:303 start_codon:yes stop_codon:yes gene_type:complete